MANIRGRPDPHQTEGLDPHFEVVARVGLKEWRELAQLSPKRE